MWFHGVANKSKTATRERVTSQYAISGAAVILLPGRSGPVSPAVQLATFQTQHVLALSHTEYGVALPALQRSDRPIAGNVACQETCRWGQCRRCRSGSLASFQRLLVLVSILPDLIKLIGLEGAKGG